MDSYEVNKIASAVIGAGLVTMVISIAGGVLVSPPRLAQPAYPIAAAAPQQPQQQAQAQAQAPQVEPITPLLASADLAAGQRLAQRCVTCHTFTPAGRGVSGQGPGLYGVIEGPKAHQEGFNYSPAMRAAAARPGDEGKWTYEELNKFLANPQAHIRGTRMNFPGMRPLQERANLIAWLRNQHPSPPPLP